MPQEQKQGLGVLALGAIGVVFGDIGTSPLYALPQCFRDLHNDRPDAAAVLGILSLIFWSLILVVCVKYVTFVMRADHDGEGGTLAMLGLIHSKGRHSLPPLNGLVLLVFAGSALLYGDGVITPSISVLSAVEGLKIATPGAQPYIVPACLFILAVLFFVQQFGTGGLGNYFGPIMILWFLVIGVLGAFGIAKDPKILAALNPLAGGQFLGSHGFTGIIVLGAVVLAFSGAEALFADLGHFGAFPIRLAWYALVLPALLLNYFGEGAAILSDPGAAKEPFYALVPKLGLYPIVVLSTAATIIASQAVISGTFSLTQQAVNMGYFPRVRIVHTSDNEQGQVYVGAVNWCLMVACLGVVAGFRSSDKLTSAYGLAIIGTMTVTSITYFVVMRRVWKWKPWKAGLLAGAFLVMDLAFFTGSIVKIFSGAIVPVLIAAVVFALYWTWTLGHSRFLLVLRRQSMPLRQFARLMSGWKTRSRGTAVFLTTYPNTVPMVGGNHWLREHASYDRVILLTVKQSNAPRVPEEKRTRVEEMAPDLIRISSEVGFMQQQPDVTSILKGPALQKLSLDWDSLVFYLPAPFIHPRRTWYHQFVTRIYTVLRRNSLTPAQYFNIPPGEIIQVGVQMKL